MRKQGKKQEKKAKLYIGTSGWMYKDWGKLFYPKDLKKGHLAYLAREFNTVEVNTSFYHLPTRKTFKRWREETPDHFIFSIKLSRHITHEKTLEKVRLPLRRFLSKAKGLGSKLGAVLIQLPPFMQFNEKVLKEFLAGLKSVTKELSFRPRFAIEPRHKSWMEEGGKVRKILSRERIALVFPHSSRIPSFEPEDANITADFVYVRFHGPFEFAASRYGPRRLGRWARKLRGWQEDGYIVFAYFNNDINGHAIYDARTLKDLAE